MPIIVYKEYVATKTGSAVKEEACEKCGSIFAYEITRTVSGHGSSPFFLANEKAQRDAAKRADSHLAQALEMSHELVACPHCGWYQSHAVNAYLDGQLRSLRFIAWIALLAGTFVALMLHVEFSNHGGKPNYPEKPGVIIFELLMITIWFGALYLRRRWVRQYDPNVTRRNSAERDS